ARDHRVHHFDVSFGAGPENSAELLAENVPLLQAEANGPPSEKRVELGVDRQMRKKLVPSKVKRSNDHGHGFQRGSRLPVGLILFFLIWKLVGADEKVLGAEKANSLGPTGFDFRRVLRLLYVCRH